MPKKAGKKKGSSASSSATSASSSAVAAAAVPASAKLPAPEQQKLPGRDETSFKELVRSSEKKDHKKALKLADELLKKYPLNGETLAMKGLTMMYLDDKERAHEFAKQGLRYNLKSHVCWHVYGLIHRNDKNYREAVKCYLKALRLNEGNLQIMKDLAILQTQLRDLDGLVDTRKKLLVVQSTVKANWLGFRYVNLSFYLDGLIEARLKAISSILLRVKTQPRSVISRI